MALDEEIRINIGIDFGTSYTKVCWRNLNMEQSGVVDFSKGTGLGWRASMIPSAVWLNRSGDIIFDRLAERESPSGFKKVDSLKMRLAGLNLEEVRRSFNFAKLRSLKQERGDIETLASAHLCNTLIRSRQWLHNHHSEMFVKRKPVWSARVGIPVRIFDSPAGIRFKRVLEKAWLASYAGIESLKNLHDAREIFRSLDSAEVDCFAYPEIAAAVQSFVSAPNAREGFYLYCDIGGGTLDGAVFRLRKENGQKKVNFYAGNIQPFGVQAVLDRHPGVSRQALADYKSPRKKPDAAVEDALEPEERAINLEVAPLTTTAKEKYRDGWRSVAEVPVFLGGGGRDLAFFDEAVFGTYRAHKLDRAGIPKFTAKVVPRPEDFDLGDVPAEEFHRFAVAYGLSIDHGAAPELLLPKDIPPMKKPPVKTTVLAGHYED